jgi:hypothetical protein
VARQSAACIDSPKNGKQVGCFPTNNAEEAEPPERWEEPKKLMDKLRFDEYVRYGKM